MIPKELIAKRIKFIRTGHFNMTQKEMSEHLNISISAISAYERGLLLPPIELLINIADTANVSLDWLCGRTDNSIYTDAPPKQTSPTNYETFLAIILELYKLNLDSSHVQIQIQDTDTRTGTITYTSTDNDAIDILKDVKEKQELLHSHTIDSEMYDVWMKHLANKLSKQ